MPRSSMKIACSLFVLCLSAVSAHAQKKYDPGASDTEVKLGQTMPYSGPVSALGIIGRVQSAYYAMINEAGGVNGRKINLITLDDGYNPAKTVEQTRRLVEQDEVLAMVGSLGTPTNVAVRKFLNLKKVPQLLVLSSSAQWSNPKEYPYSTSFFLAADQEAASLAKYVLEKYPSGKIGFLYQNDDYGKDYINGFKKALGDKADKLIVKDLSYEVSSPTIDSQIVAIKAAGADIFIAAATTKFAAMAVRKIAELNWEPTRFLAAGAISSLGSALDPQIAKGVISMLFHRDPNDPALESEKEGQEYFAFMKKYAPTDNPKDMSSLLGYLVAQLSTHIIRQSGDNLTHDNIMASATHLNNTPIKLLLEGVEIRTSPTNYLPIAKARLVQFDGKSWTVFGPAIEVSPLSTE